MNEISGHLLSFNEKLEHISKGEYLIVNKEGSIEQTHLLRYCFEQLCGLFGCENRCDKELIELSFMELIESGSESQAIDNATLEKVRSIAIKNGLMFGEKTTAIEEKIGKEKAAVHQLVDLVSTELNTRIGHDSERAREIIQNFWNKTSKFQQLSPILHDKLNPENSENLHRFGKVREVFTETVPSVLELSKSEEPLLVEQGANDIKIEPAITTDASSIIEGKSQPTPLSPSQLTSPPSLKGRDIKQQLTNPNVEELLKKFQKDIALSPPFFTSFEELVNQRFEALMDDSYSEKNVLHKEIKKEILQQAQGFDGNRLKYIENKLSSTYRGNRQ